MYRDGFNSKRQLIKRNADTRNKIYSKNTFETYKRQFRYFAEWLSEAHSDALTLADARGYVDEYLLHLVKLERSAYSITTAKAALAKSFRLKQLNLLIPLQGSVPTLNAPGVLRFVIRTSQARQKSNYLYFLLQLD